MMQSNSEVPQFTVSISIEMDKALDLRSRYNAIHPDQPLSINDLIIRGAALVLQRYPHLNSSYQGQELEYHSHINIGIAVTLDEGLMTVVLREADHKSLAQISTESKILIQRAKDNKNRAEDIEGSTFTISNLGMFGIDDFVAIINPPEAAILAVGAVQVQPKFMDGTWIPCSMAKFNLSIDHRVSDGAEAARYLKELKTYLEEPIHLI
jgi:Pyruvate/2-oxoglutarate dehydrogenase complex, dihydrolipoamide acyltransferase (E2) component, and related enzymes